MSAVLINYIRCLFHCASTLTTMLVLPLPAIAADSADAVVAQIMRDWKARRTAMARVHYVIKGTRMTPKGMMTEDVREIVGKADGEVPPRDQVDDVSVDMLIDFERQWYRVETYEPPRPGLEDFNLGYQVSRCVRFGDGGFSQVWYPDRDDQHVQLSVAPRRPAQSALTVSAHHAPICYAHGFVDPELPRMFRRVRLDPQDFIVHAVTGRGENRVVVLRSHTDGDGSWKEWWVDLGRKSAVTKHIVHLDATRRFLELQIEYKKTAIGWLPSRWRMQDFEFDAASSLYCLWTFNVEKIEINPPVTDSMFHKKLEPGMVVRDGTADRIYVVAKDGTPGPDFAAVRRTRAIREVRAEDRRRKRWRWMPVLVVGVALCGAAALLYLKRRR